MRFAGRSYGKSATPPLQDEAGLPPRERLRLGCYYAEGLTLAQTGRLLGEHESSVSRQLARTRKTIRREIEKAGFTIEEMRGSAIPIRLIIGRWMPGVLLRAAEAVLATVTQWWRALLAYQFVIAARPRR